MEQKNILMVFAAVLALALIAAGCDYQNSSDAPGSQPAAQAQAQEQQSTQTAEQTQAGAQEQSTEVKCNSDTDCGKEILGEPYCFQGNILIPRNIPKCEYPGTINSKCRMESKDKTILCSSSEFCRDGECLVTAEQPCKDTDGGRNYDEAGTVTDGLNEIFVDNCANEVTLFERYCSDGDFGRGLTEEYRCRDKCSNGACVEEN